MAGRAETAKSAGRRVAGWNPNKMFGRLSIRTKLAVAFLLLSGLPVATVGWYAADQHLRSLREAATTEQQRRLEQVQRQVETFLTAVRQDLDFLASSPSVAASAGIGEPSARTLPVGLSMLRDILASKPYYHRIRLLGTDGTELVNVVRGTAGPVAMPGGRWRGTGYRYYRALIGQEGALAVQFSPVEIRDGANTANPSGLIAAFSFARGIDTGEAGGMALLVADVYASELLGLLQAEAGGPDRRFMLVGPSGHFLYHSAAKTNWNTLLAGQAEHTLAREFDAGVAAEILTGSGSLVSNSPGWVIAYARLLGEARTHGGSYTLVSAVTEESAFAPVFRVQRVVFALGAMSVLLAGGLAFLAAHQFTSPIRQLRQGVARVSAGDFDEPVSVGTNDELEDLGRSFTSMARALETRESELVHQRRQLETLLDTMGEGVAVVRLDGTVVFVNRFLSDRFGEPGGRSAGEMFSVQAAECQRCDGTGLGDAGPCECRAGPAADGHDYDVLSVGLDEYEGAPAILEIHRDATQRRRLEYQVEQHTHHLETMVEDRTRELRASQGQMIHQEKMVAVGQLAAGLAHELGTPLAAILCQAEMALEELDGQQLGGGAIDNVRTIVGQTERTRQIVRSLLDFSRPSTGERELLDLREIVASACALLGHDFGRRAVKLMVGEEPESAIVLGNRNELEQLLVNLMRNAADAMPDGGTVRVDIGTTADRCRIQVADNGAGIDPEIRDRLFEPFFTTKPPGQGTGLGLWISYNIAREHGGSLTIRRAGSSGTTMEVALPRPPGARGEA